MADQKVGYEAQRSMLRHVDLCSGIGGFALGFEWAELSRPVLFCDIEPWSRKVLRKHWPDVPIAEDVKELANDPDGLIPECDIITAGYPCQPFSVAGDRRGTEDDRHIWPEIFTIIKRKRPSFCVFENVYGHISMGIDEVLSDLEGAEYSTRAFVVPAVACDAPHRRDRVWIIARNVGNTQYNGSPSPALQRSSEEASNNNTQGQIKASQSEGASQSRNSEGMEASTRADNVGNTFSSRQQRINRRQSEQEFKNGCKDVANTKSLHSNGSTEHSQQGQRQEPQPRDSSSANIVANPSSQRLQGSQRLRKNKTKDRKRGEGANGSAAQCSDDARRKANLWLPEPPVGRVAHGIPRRVDRLRGLGNAIVPQIAQRIGETIKNSI